LAIVHYDQTISGGFIAVLILSPEENLVIKESLTTTDGGRKTDYDKKGSE
jgi:hypothetical protein